MLNETFGVYLPDDAINNASSNGHLEVAKYHYETCDADIETKDKYRWTPLSYASVNNHLEIVRYLYEVLRTSNIHNNKNYCCALISYSKK